MNNKLGITKGPWGDTPDTLNYQRAIGWGGLYVSTYMRKLRSSVFFGVGKFILQYTENG
jgi:hypothetical protein